MKILFGVLFISVLFFSKVHAQIYQWEDDKGGVHFSDDLSQVPPEKRSKSEKSDIQKKIDQNVQVITVTPGPSNPQSTPPTSNDSPGEGNGNPAPGSTNNSFKNQLDTKKDELTQAKKDLELVYLDRRKNLESGPGMQQRQADLVKRENELQQKIKGLESAINEKIPEASRQAGDPPGALR